MEGSLAVARGKDINTKAANEMGKVFSLGHVSWVWARIAQTHPMPHCHCHHLKAGLGNGRHTLRHLCKKCHKI